MMSNQLLACWHPWLYLWWTLGGPYFEFSIKKYKINQIIPKQTTWKILQMNPNNMTNICTCSVIGSPLVLLNFYESIHRKKKTDLTSVSSSNQDVLLLADIAINSFLPMIAVHIRVHMFQNQIHLSKQTSFISNSTNVCSKKNLDKPQWYILWFVQVFLKQTLCSNFY